MGSLIQNLIERAEALRDGAEATRDEIQRKYAETEAQLSRLKAALDQIQRMPTRHELLLSAYQSGKRLCPDCSLHRGIEIPMVATQGGTNDVDVFKCPSCGLEEEGEP
jgi:hypothetical protein